MNVLKNMEAIFLAATVLVGVTSAAQAASVAKHASYDAQVTIEGQQMAVVKVTAKRLPAAAKAAI
jgi:RES domain-containing protein